MEEVVVVVSAVGWERSWCSCGCPLDFVVVLMVAVAVVCVHGDGAGVSDGWHESGWAFW